jgi:molybdenum cofactor cytidylyltransferase
LQLVIKDKIGVIILAAGESSRLGKAKQLLPFNGVSLLQHAAQVAIDAVSKPIVVVLGAASSEISKELTNYKVNIIENKDWQTGMASSIKTGLLKIQELFPDLAGVILMVCDQPFVNPHLLRKMQVAWQNSGKGIVACSYGDTAGTPALFSKDYFDELLRLQGQEGAKKIIKAYQSFINLVSFPLGQVDIDTEEDYKNLDQNAPQF